MICTGRVTSFSSSPVCPIYTHVSSQYHHFIYFFISPFSYGVIVMLVYSFTISHNYPWIYLFYLVFYHPLCVIVLMHTHLYLSVYTFVYTHIFVHMFVRMVTHVHERYKPTSCI
ncbi:hypothetical protein MACJ_003494 [Theileria orientalis]|uniref:Uncharacterized protein n=1 Tax=Theileria orientalis TaxID=68886 RepID=A0A976SK92_THEOR|nr:hypothetical protein MACJ_003494 [Theileria orientalis]